MGGISVDREWGIDIDEEVKHITVLPLPDDDIIYPSPTPSLVAAPWPVQIIMKYPKVLDW